MLSKGNGDTLAVVRGSSGKFKGLEANSWRLSGRTRKANPRINQLKSKLPMPILEFFTP